MSAQPTAETAQPSAETTAAAEDSTADASSLFVVALRDLALVLGALSLWAGADAWYRASEAGVGAVLSSLVGLLAGAFTAAQLHEWGHFTGARISGGTAPIVPARKIVPLFLFDFERSEDRHFRWMSVGGNLAHWAAALLLFLVIPLETPGGLALACGALGFAAFATSVELPVIRRAFEGVPGAEALKAIRPETLRRSGWIGLGTALLGFTLL